MGDCGMHILGCCCCFYGLQACLLTQERREILARDPNKKVPQVGIPDMKGISKQMEERSIA